MLDATLTDIVKKIPTLGRIFNKFAKSVGLYSHETIFTLKDADAITYVTPDGKFDNPWIVFYRAAFSSYRYLAHTMLHKFGHVTSYLSHNFFNNFTNNNGDFTDKWNRAVAQDELFAHRFAFKHDGIPYQDSYSWQTNINKLK